MNKYDELLENLDLIVKKLEQQEEEVRGKLESCKEKKEEFIKEKESLDKERKRLEKIKDILITYNMKKSVKDFINYLPAFIFILLGINIILIKFLALSTLPLIALVNGIIIMGSIWEEYVPSISQLKVIMNNKKEDVLLALDKIFKQIKKIEQRIGNNDKEIEEKQKDLENIQIKRGELEERKDDILIKKAKAEEHLRDKFDKLMDAEFIKDETLRRIRVSKVG